MKKVLIALLLGMTLVGCGAKRDVNCVSVADDYMTDEYYFEQKEFDKGEVMTLIKKDIENADVIYKDYTNLIKTDNYIIVYGVCSVEGDNYIVWIYDIYNGDKEYIEYMYDAVKSAYDETFLK